MMKRLIRIGNVWILCLSWLVLAITSGEGMAAQQYQGLCSYVKIEILQELTLERIGFLATLEVTNNEGDASITDFSASLIFEKEGVGGVLEDASEFFFVQPPKISGINNIDGAGIIAPGQTARVEWFMIPKRGAGGITPEGLMYQIGASLAGSLYGKEISPEVFMVLPDTITVKPDPELEITYFQPRDVDGDNPFTPDIVESPIPFTLGVLIKNVGYGTARKVKIASQQPRIVENEQGLLVVPQLIGSRVDDQPTDNTTLNIDFGDIEPTRCRKGAWDMITTLSGEFTEFKASYTHATELGGEETSLIKSVDAYFMVHEVLNDQPGRDELLDFLAETLGGEQLIPDTLYESDCNTLPVNRLTDVEVLSQDGFEAAIRATADFENWVFMRLDDPGQAKYAIDSIVRSDGKVLNPHNYWTNIRYRKPDNAKLTYLNIFDFVALGEYEYTVTYQPVGSDTEPPVTTIYFSGPSQKKDDIYYVLPETQIFFIAEDASPVGTYYRIDGIGDFLPAYPFTITEGGEHTVEYYSRDVFGNEEATLIATVVVSVDDPAIANITSDTSNLFITGDSVTIRSTDVTTTFSGVMTGARLDAVVDVYRGVFGYPTVSSVPSSPTVEDTASLVVGGENVDFYRYRLGSFPWSNEFPVTQPIDLTALTGTVQLSILGRNRYNEYPDESDAVSVSWVVDSGASSLEITGTPATPSRSSQASMSVVGSDYYCYRVDGNYYRPDSGVGDPILLTRLTDGAHTVEVLPRADAGEACPGDVPGTKVSWTVDRLYGLDFPEANKVKHEDLGQVDTNQVSFTWDGRTDSGAAVPPGWYSVRIMVTDGLGRSAGSVQLIRVNDMADGQILADAGNAGQKEAHAFGDWVVWQDQRNTNWDVYALDLNDTAAVPVAVTSNTLNQERPRTDGTYVVWEDRQPDGSWDVRARELGGAQAAFSITSTLGVDEQKPSIYYPWVVYQIRSSATPDAPWQLQSYNMETGEYALIDPTTQNQLDPVVQRGRVVWQDFRDVGFGEIYLKDLVTGEVRRITNNPGGQYHPVIFNQWIVWDDNRNTQLDLYGYNLKRNVEIRLTDTPEDESRPFIFDKWVVYQEDSAGEQNGNLRMLHLDNLASVQLTNFESNKEKPAMASGKLLWTDFRAGQGIIMAGRLPDLQPGFNNRNTVAVTADMVSGQGDAYTLLALWNAQAGVEGITHYSSLITQPVAEVASWSGGAPVGDNFALNEGDFLWVRFNTSEILDLGQNGCGSVDLPAGQSVFSYSCFPDNYSAYQVVRELGSDNITSIRVLDSRTGQWQAATVIDGQVVGDDFAIAPISVLMIETTSALGTWSPGEGL